MPAFATCAFRLSAAAILFLSLLVPLDAEAQSRRDRQAAEILQQRMDVAETRYREALVRARNNEPGAVTESDAALEDMEDVVVECGKLRGCDPANFVTTFKRLLKAGADEAATDPEDEIDPFDPDPDGMLAGSVGADVPEAAPVVAPAKTRRGNRAREKQLLKELGGHAPDRGRIKKLLGGDETIVTLEQRVNALVAAGVPREALTGKDADEVEEVAAREAKLENKWRPPTRMIYDAIVVDESSKLKSHSSNRFRAARLLARHVEYFVILTGTPAANGYIDLWAQIYLLDFGKRLGENITAFRDRWFKQNFNGHGYKVQDYAVKVIEERISDIVFTLREEDYANLPPRMYNDIVLEFDEATAKKDKPTASKRSTGLRSLSRPL